MGPQGRRRWLGCLPRHDLDRRAPQGRRRSDLPVETLQGRQVRGRLDDGRAQGAAKLSVGPSPQPLRPRRENGLLARLVGPEKAAKAATQARRAPRPEAPEGHSVRSNPRSEASIKARSQDQAKQGLAGGGATWG